MNGFVEVCELRRLPAELELAAAMTAVTINPANAPVIPALLALTTGPGVEPQHIALLTSRYWGSQGVKLTVGFMGISDLATQRDILKYLNLWSERANVAFVGTTDSAAQVRIARTRGDGYWSYLGTDILHIPAGRPTMNLDSFATNWPESEKIRVIAHEAGHTLGFVHEHLRKAIVDRIDPLKAITYFRQTQGWTPEMVRQQVLTPIEESLLNSNDPDQQSIMCYQLPGAIMTDGQPVPGGSRIDESDWKLVSTLYPKVVVTPPSPPTGAKVEGEIRIDGRPYVLTPKVTIPEA